MRDDHFSGVSANEKRNRDSSEIAVRDEFNRQHPPTTGLVVSHDLRKVELPERPWRNNRGHYSRVAAVVSSSIALSIVLAACGGSPTASPGESDTAQQSKAVAVYERFNALSGTARTDELVKCAEEEGELSIYTSNNDIDVLVKGFEDLYDIKASAYRANSETVLQRILQEQKAKYYGNDVIETNAAEMNILNNESLFFPYEGELRDSVRKEGQKENWTANRFNAFVVGWNTDLVKPGEEPKTFEDLADPKWKGKLSMEIGDVDWYTALHEYWKSEGKTQEQVDALFSGIVANSKIAKGHTVQVELMAAGQFAVSMSSYSSSVDNAAREGAPVAWKSAQGRAVEPIVVRANGVGLMKDASNPCAAALFIDFALTGGQKLLEKVMRIPSVLGGFDPLEGLKVIEVPEEELLANSKVWSDKYAELTQKGSK